MNEALAATVAAELGLPMPQAFLVRIDAPFINSVRSEALRERLTRTPIAFALQDLGANWRKWNSTDRLMPARAFLALQVFAFDAFIGNNDRSPIRPNLMTSPQAGEIALIDHENAFWLRVHFAHRVEPWKLGNLNPLSIRGAESEHLFFRSLHRTSPLDVGSVGKTWERLTDDRLAAYSAALPPEWASAGTGLNDALHHLGTVRDRMAECLKELVRVLS